MSFEEILELPEDFSSYKTADITKPIEDQILVGELQLPNEAEKVKENGENLQQKYLPYKFKIPGENLIKSFEENGKNLVSLEFDERIFEA